MIEFMQRMGSAVCHRLAERSFIWEGMQMPLCARCTGIYIGAFFAFCFFFRKKRLEAGKPFSALQAILTALAIIPIGLDGVGSYLGFWESSQLVRILTGSLVGAIVPGFLLMAGNFDPKRENEELIYENTAELLLLMAVSVGFGLCLWVGIPIIGIGAVISIIGEVLLWGSVLWMILKTLLKDGKKNIRFISVLIVCGVLYMIGGLVP